MHIKIRVWVKILFCLIVIVSTFFLYSRYLGTKGFIVKEYPIINSNIPNNFYGFKIIHISDIHYKVTTTKKDLKKIVNDINLLKPDIVVFTGDLFNNQIKYTNKDYKDLTEIFNNINYNIKKYAIKGDNDNKKEWEQIMNDSGFSNLNDTFDTIYYNGITPINIVGISSNLKNNHIKDTIQDINSKINTQYYSILLIHEPDYINEIDYSNYNLILGGHSLNGQIVFPYTGGILKNNKATSYYKEYYKLNNSELYISSGIGTIKYKFRFMNKPSFNLYRLRNA